MFGLGPLEIAIIVAILVLVFGVGRLPELGAGVGRALKNFKTGFSEAEKMDAKSFEEQNKERDEEQIEDIEPKP